MGVAGGDSRVGMAKPLDATDGPMISEKEASQACPMPNAHPIIPWPSAQDGQKTWYSCQEYEELPPKEK